MADKSLLQRVWRCTAAMAGNAVWTFVRRFVLLLMAAVVVASAGALLFWGLAVPAAGVPDGLALGIGVATLICYLIAGALWAMHRSCNAAVESALPLFVQHSPELLNAVIDPLVARCPLQDRQIAVADAQRALNELFGSERLPTEADSELQGIGTVRRLSARRFAAAELTIVQDVLQSLEARGERNVSIASLSTYLQEKFVAGMAELARSQTRSLGFVVAIVVFLLALAPVVMVWLVQG